MYLAENELEFLNLYMEMDAHQGYKHAIII
jgi:hypothetical protein